MQEPEALAHEFETHRGRLRGVAYRMLGSLSEADDAVQEAWLRLSRSDAGAIEDLGRWLTTVVARICLDMLRSRSSRREESLTVHVPDPIVSRDDGSDPEHQALMADSVGLALLVVLDTLTPAERIAFVLHDVFAVPFEDIAPIVGRSTAAARQLASRARRRVQAGPAAPAAPETDRQRQRELVAAFVAASQSGDFKALLAVLDPDVVMRLDRGPAPSRVVRGSTAVVEQRFSFSGQGWVVQRALVNGAPGIVLSRGGRAFAVVGFTVARDRIAQIDILADAARLRDLDLPALED